VINWRHDARTPSRSRDTCRRSGRRIHRARACAAEAMRRLSSSSKELRDQRPAPAARADRRWSCACLIVDRCSFQKQACVKPLLKISPSLPAVRPATGQPGYGPRTIHPLTSSQGLLHSTTGRKVRSKLLWLHAMLHHPAGQHTTSKRLSQDSWSNHPPTANLCWLPLPGGLGKQVIVQAIPPRFYTAGSLCRKNRPTRP